MVKDIVEKKKNFFFLDISTFSFSKIIFQSLTIFLTLTLNQTTKSYIGPNKSKQEDHDGPISLTWVLSSKGWQSYVPTCDPQGEASFDPRGIKWTNLVRVH